MVKHMQPTDDMWADDPKADGIVIPVNCLLRHGKGVAKDWAERFPETAAYIRSLVPVDIGVLLSPGTARLHEEVDGIRWFMATTKDHWRDPSRIEWIRGILKDLVQETHIYDVKSVKVPALGCGLGGLDWKTVISLCEQYLEDSPTAFYLYPPK